MKLGWVSRGCIEEEQVSESERESEPVSEETAEQPSILEIAKKPYVLENEAKIAADASEKSKSPN
jgi:hypothetical protein